MKIIFSFCRWASVKIFHEKTAKKQSILTNFLALFLAVKFAFCLQRAPKNDFHVKLLLETCSGGSNYP